MGRSPAREGRAVSLSKTWNVAKLCSKISSSWRMSSRFSAALRVIESSDGAGLAIDAPLASDNDNPPVRLFLLALPAKLPLRATCKTLPSSTSTKSPINFQFGLLKLLDGYSIAMTRATSPIQPTFFPLFHTSQL